MPVPVTLSDPNQIPLTPPAPPQKPPIKVALGTELLPILTREGGDSPATLFAGAVRHELGKAFPLEVVIVELGREAKSFIGRDQDLALGAEDDSHALAEKAVPIIMRVLGNPARYQWNGKPLATPEQAIAYMLERCQRDADLGHLVGPGTQAYRLLCEAEAGLTHARLSDVMERRGRTLTTEPRRYLTATEHQRAQEKREEDEHA